MANQNLTLVFVHGYSVTDLTTYGELPLRLKNEAAARNINLQVEEIFLGEYISFQDEVKLADVSRAFNHAIATKLKKLLDKNGRFICITHSTGGPVVREWFQFYHAGKKEVCPMSHLIMLAPANFGSALAQLGKGRLSRLKTWFQGVEPGQGVLDWLELGSKDAWEVNEDWIRDGEKYIGKDQTFPFVLTGQSIDRKFYDHLNAYTGELGSDGVIRVAAANLNARYVNLAQTAGKLNITEYQEAPKTAFRIIRGKAHGGGTMGIQNSVKKNLSDTKSQETVDSIFRCLQVNDKAAYAKLTKQFAEENVIVQEAELVEKQEKRLVKDRYFIHDRYFQVIFKVMDEQGYPVTDFDLLLLGPGHDPGNLPEGFFKDRQRNRLCPNVITYYFNFDLMVGCEAVIDPVSQKVLREAQPGISELGVMIIPRPQEGFVRYMPATLHAKEELMDKVVDPNSTTLLEIKLKRLVSDKVFQLVPVEGDTMPKHSFKKTKPGNGLVE